MDRVDRLHGAEVRGKAFKGTRHGTTAVRKPGGNGARPASQSARSDQMMETTAIRAELGRDEEGLLKRIFKAVFLNVSGDTNVPF